MCLYRVEMKHTAESFEALAHMQYDLLCGRNRAARTLIGAALIVGGAAGMPAWWSFLLVGYGAYLLTSKYASANHTAHSLVKVLNDSGMPFPRSRLEFMPDKLCITALPENERLEQPIEYFRLRGLGEDRNYLYLFRDEHGGYMVPKNALGNKLPEFKTFIEQKTSRSFRGRRSPLMEMIDSIKARRSEPYHL